MIYAEWLRIRNVLRGYAYVLLALFIVVVGLRVYFNSQFDVSHFKQEAFARGAHVTTQTLPDGTVRTIIDNPSENNTHIVYDDRGWHGKHVTVTTGTATHNAYSSGRTVRDRTFGVLSVKSNEGVTSSTYDIDTEGQPIDIGYLFAFSVLVGLIMATILGAPLARENLDHLEVVFTKPVSRISYALQVFLADLGAIFGAFVFTVVAMLASVALFQVPEIMISNQGFMLGLVAVLASFAWYATYVVLSSWMKRGRGAVLGLAWVVTIVIEPLAAFPLGDSGLGQFVHATFRGLAMLDPLAYINLRLHSMPGDAPPAISTMGIFGLSVEATALVLAALTVVYLAGGIVQWQRVEA